MGVSKCNFKYVLYISIKVVTNEANTYTTALQCHVDVFFLKSAHNKCLILPIKAMSIEMKCHKKSALYTMGYIQNNNMCPIHLRSTVTNITASIRLDFATIHIEQQT